MLCWWSSESSCPGLTAQGEGPLRSSELGCAALSSARVTIVCMTASAWTASPVPHCKCRISELMMFTLKCACVCVHQSMFSTDPGTSWFFCSTYKNVQALGVLSCLWWVLNMKAAGACVCPSGTGHVILAQTQCGPGSDWSGQLHSLSWWVDRGGQGVVWAGLQLSWQVLPSHPTDGQCHRLYSLSSSCQ